MTTSVNQSSGGARPLGRRHIPRYYSKPQAKLGDPEFDMQWSMRPNVRVPTSQASNCSRWQEAEGSKQREDLFPRCLTVV